MKMTHLAGVAALALAALTACTDDLTTPKVAPPAASPESVVPGSENNYIVVFHDNVANAPGLARELVKKHGGLLGHTYRHALKGFAAVLPPSAVEALRKNPNVAYVRKDGLVTLSTTQTSAPWSVDRIDQHALPLNTNYTYTRTGTGVKIYVIDTGIDSAHAQFGGRVQFGFDATGGTGTDCDGHGTESAGAAGGSTYGSAKQVTLVNVRVFGCTVPGPTSNVLAGIDWVRANHVKPAIANMSINSGNDTTVDRAVRNLVAAGVTVVAAAGNSYVDACTISPGRVPEALNVSASTTSDAPASWAAYGSCVDLYAPGENIPVPFPGGITTMSGTSLSAPLVAGVAAQYLEANPAAPPSAVVSAVLLAATPGAMSGLASGSPNLLLYSSQTPTYRKIVNRWQTTKYINVETGLAASTILPGWWSAQWEMQPVAGTQYYRIRNRYTSDYLHAEYGPVQAGAVLSGWLSAQWELEGSEGYFRIRNRYRGTYLHVEYGSLQLGTISSTWHSAMWRFEDTGVTAP